MFCVEESFLTQCKSIKFHLTKSCRVIQIFWRKKRPHILPYMSSREGSILEQQNMETNDLGEYWLWRATQTHKHTCIEILIDMKNDMIPRSFWIFSQAVSPNTITKVGRLTNMLKLNFPEVQRLFFRRYLTVQTFVDSKSNDNSIRNGVGCSQDPKD
jgi:hypothetical protein